MADEAEADAQAGDQSETIALLLHRLLARLVDLAKDDAELRGMLRSTAEHLLEHLTPLDPPLSAESDEDEPVAHAAMPESDVDEPAVRAAPVADAEPLQHRIERVLEERQAERAEASVAPSEVATQQASVAQTAPPQSVVDTQGRMLAQLAADASLKAEAALWVGERQRRLARGVDFASEIAPGDRELLGKAQTADVYLWMCRRDAPVPPDVSDWDRLAGNYEALADALRLNALVLEQDELSDSLDQAMALLAEAQSALRLSVDELDERSDDTQREAFYWLKRTTDRLRIYLSRHMRLNDPADPTQWGALRERCAELYDKLLAQLESHRNEVRQWGRLRYHLQRTRGALAGDMNDEWTKALDAVGQLVNEGVAPSSVKLRDALLPYIDEIPDDVDASQGVVLTLREIDRYLASREAEAERSGDESDLGGMPSEDEEKVRALLTGRALVLIGGIQRPLHQRRIERAFGLSELIWLDGGAASYTEFEPAISRADVAAVVLLIRWSSHGYGDVKAYCDTYDKPLIRIPAGYNPKQLAHQILEQGAVRLGAGSEDPESV